MVGGGDCEDAGSHFAAPVGPIARVFRFRGSSKQFARTRRIRRHRTNPRAAHPPLHGRVDLARPRVSPGPRVPVDGPISSSARTEVLGVRFLCQSVRRDRLVRRNRIRECDSCLVNMSTISGPKSAGISPHRLVSTSGSGPNRVLLGEHFFQPGDEDGIASHPPGQVWQTAPRAQASKICRSSNHNRSRV